MSTSVNGLSTNFFPDAESGFTTTTAGSVASGATTVALNSVAGYTNGMPGVFVIDPTDTVKKQTFTGIVDTAGVQVTSVVWTAGTNQTHILGATVVDYATATHIAMISKGILVSHDQDGTLKAGAVDNAACFGAGVVDNTALATGTSGVDNAHLNTTAGDIGGAWLGYAATCLGFTATVPTNTVYRYNLIGKKCTVMVRQITAGTSNSAEFNISLPFTSATITNGSWTSTGWGLVDNGVVQTAACYVDISSNSSVMAIYKDGAGTAMTASGGKRLNETTITYEIA